jgi:hypothetical protein
MRARPSSSGARLVSALGLALLGTCACDSWAEKPPEPNLQLVHKFTSAWLVDKNFVLAKSFLSPSFFLLEGPQGRGAEAPPGPEGANETLEFATLCSSGCRTGEDCFFSLDDRSDSVWTRERLHVGETEVAADSRLSRLLDQDIEVFSSRLSGCGHVLAIGVRDLVASSPDEQRIAFIYLVAP